MTDKRIRVWDCPSFGCIAVSALNTERFGNQGINLTYKEAETVLEELELLLQEIYEREEEFK